MTVALVPTPLLLLTCISAMHGVMCLYRYLLMVASPKGP
jgi:hypothetical protein